MEIRDRIQELKASQKQMESKYEELFEEISANDSIKENIEMKKEIENLKVRLVRYEKKIEDLQRENMNVKISLNDQIISERSGVIERSKQKMNIYFNSENNFAVNQLHDMEESIESKIEEIYEVLERDFRGECEDIERQIDTIKLKLEDKINAKNENLEESYLKTMEEIKEDYDNLKLGPVNKEVLAKKQKHNDLEVKIGLNWINRIGVILLLLGVATGLRYTYSEWFNDYMKALSVFILGGVMLGVGELYNRKTKNLFALGLCGGGIGTLYLAVFSSYFFFNILNLPVSMVLAVLITIVSITLSKRYDSKTIAAISLIGGYLPFFSFAFIMEVGGSSVYVAMGYLMALNLLVLSLAIGRRWIHMNYLSFILNIPCLALLVFESPSELVGLLYALLTFAMYLGVTLAYPVLNKIKLRISDLILLAFNTVINSAIVYWIFILFYKDCLGFLALIYALGYFSLSKLITIRFPKEKHTQALFNITTLTFAILMIPLQFGMQWASMGWLIEALLILIVAKKQDVGEIELGGWILLGLCTFGFFVEDASIGSDMSHFVIKYSLLSLGHIYVLLLYIPKYKDNVDSFKRSLFGILKYIVILNTWIYSLRIAFVAFVRYIELRIPSSYVEFYMIILLAMITAIFAYVIVRIGIIKDTVVRIISFGLLGLSSFVCVGLNLYTLEPTDNPSAKWFAVVILILYNVFVFFNIKDIIVQLVRAKRLNIEHYPLILIIYFLGTTSSLLNSQLSLEGINLIISLLFLASSFGCILFGFKKGFALIRRFGLGLSIFSVVKLFLFDLSDLTGIGRIIAYFCFGLILLGISFIYQKLKSSEVE